MLADQVPVTSDVRPDDFKRFASYENFDSKGHIKIEEIVSSTQCVLRWITVTNIRKFDILGLFSVFRDIIFIFFCLKQHYSYFFHLLSYNIDLTI